VFVETALAVPVLGTFRQTKKVLARFVLKANLALLALYWRCSGDFYALGLLYKLVHHVHHLFI
jgi:hypothetical protein